MEIYILGCTKMLFLFNKIRILIYIRTYLLLTKRTFLVKKNSFTTKSYALYYYNVKRNARD